VHIFYTSYKLCLCLRRIYELVIICPCLYLGIHHFQEPNVKFKQSASESLAFENSWYPKLGLISRAQWKDRGPILVGHVKSLLLASNPKFYLISNFSSYCRSPSKTCHMTIYPPNLPPHAVKLDPSILIFETIYIYILWKSIRCSRIFCVVMQSTYLCLFD
jgi:hypothetical protein